LFKRFYSQLVADAGDLPKEVARRLQAISALRNVGEHGGSEKKFNSMIAVTGNNWRKAFDLLDTTTTALCELVVKFEAELRARGLSPQ
jgi:hypothetical protein